jgi:hypothetical protein
MHAAWLFRERIRQVAAAAEPHHDLLRPAPCAGSGILLLALIRQAIAVPTGEQLAGEVELGNSPPTVLSVGRDVAYEPGTLATEVATGPRDGDSLPDILPLGGIVEADPVGQQDGVRLNQDGNRATRLIIPRPIPTELKSRPQQMVPAVMWLEFRAAQSPGN